LNYQQIRAFHAVARDGSVSGAARGLGVSQPTLSSHIKELQDRHKIRLFARRGRSLELTVTGAQLFAATARMMEVVEEIEDLLRGTGATEIGGRLQVAADGPRHAAALLAGFRARHPAPEVSLTVTNAPAALRLLLDGHVDAALVADPPASSGLHFLPLGFDPLVAVMARGHPLAALDRVPVSALASETALVREPGSRTRAIMLGLLDEHGVSPARTVEIGTREAIREAIGHGLGLSLIIASEVGDDRRVEVRPLDVPPPGPGSTEYLVCRSERRRQPIIRAFMEVAAEYAERRTAAGPAGRP
jgi:aminoethylphosphonate catabolism LysR family transcriptional regulator